MRSTVYTLAIENCWNNNQKINATTKYPIPYRQNAMVVKIVCNLTEIYCSFVPAHQTRELYLFNFFPSSVAVSTQPSARVKKEKGYMETIKRVMMSLLGLQKWLERERLTAFFLACRLNYSPTVGAAGYTSNKNTIIITPP